MKKLLLSSVLLGGAYGANYVQFLPCTNFQFPTTVVQYNPQNNFVHLCTVGPVKCAGDKLLFTWQNFQCTNPQNMMIGVAPVPPYPVTANGAYLSSGPSLGYALFQTTSTSCLNSYEYSVTVPITDHFYIYGSCQWTSSSNYNGNCGGQLVVELSSVYNETTNTCTPPPPLPPFVLKQPPTYDDAPPTYANAPVKVPKFSQGISQTVACNTNSFPTTATAYTTDPSFSLLCSFTNPLNTKPCFGDSVAISWVNGACDNPSNMQVYVTQTASATAPVGYQAIQSSALASVVYGQQCASYYQTYTLTMQQFAVTQTNNEFYGQVFATCTQRYNTLDCGGALQVTYNTLYSTATQQCLLTSSEAALIPPPPHPSPPPPRPPPPQPNRPPLPPPLPALTVAPAQPGLSPPPSPPVPSPPAKPPPMTPPNKPPPSPSPPPPFPPNPPPAPLPTCDVVLQPLCRACFGRFNAEKCSCLCPFTKTESIIISYIVLPIVSLILIS